MKPLVSLPVNTILVLVCGLYFNIAKADGPFAPSFIPHKKEGQCVAIKRSKACERRDQSYLVNKADGSGTTYISLIEDNTLSYSTISKTAEKLGEPLFPKDDSYTKKTLAARSYRGLMLKDEGKIIEPAVYPFILPVSDKVALAQANESTRFYGKSNPYYTPTNKFYFVGLDGKVTKPSAPGMDPNTFYYIGGYYGGIPAQVFERVSSDPARGTVTLRQFDGYGNERAVYDNFVPETKKTNADAYELSFLIDNMSGNFVASALHPDTGELASMRFSPSGDFLGYGGPVAIRSIVTNSAKNLRRFELLTVVGQLPMLTDFEDETLYHPVDETGEKIPAPENFIGMSRMYSSRSDGDHTTGNVYYENWLLVYALPTGYGFKISNGAGRPVHNSHNSKSALNVLADEQSLKMLSGFAYRKISHKLAVNLIRPFDNYEEDQVTPASGALPAKWQRVLAENGSSLTITGRSHNTIGGKTFATADEALSAINLADIQQQREYAQGIAAYRKEAAAKQAERDAERARRDAELQAHFAKEAKKRAEALAKERLRPKTGAEEFEERMALMTNHWNRKHKADFGPGARICYDMGDGSDFCFAY